MPDLIQWFMAGLCLGSGTTFLYVAWDMRPKPLFRCSGCHRDIYPPAYKRLHVGLATYCADCEAKYWAEGAEALRARME